MSRGDVEVRRTASGRWGIVLQGTFATQADAEAQARYVAQALGVDLRGELALNDVAPHAVRGSLGLDVAAAHVNRANR